MTIVLNLGVDPENMPYADDGKTVGDVAEILEDKFGVMGIFAGLHGKDIAENLADSLAGELENIAAGKRVPADPLLSAYPKIEATFRRYIEKEEHGIHLKKHDTRPAGTRKKRQYRKVEAKHTAFVDTGAYKASFKVWAVIK